MPLFHVHGLVASTLATLATGGTVVVPAKFNPLSFWQTAREHRATWYSAVPTIHQLLLARVKPGVPRPAGAEKLRFIRSCSAALPPQVMHDLEAAFGAPVLEAYGMTEAAHQMSSNPLPPAARKPGSVGRGTDVQISIMDARAGILPTGERGEVVIQGPNVIRRLREQPRANASSFTDGWFRTGDQGVLDEHGYLTLIGRLKELINRGGEKISPREIDEVLLTHPASGRGGRLRRAAPAWGEEVAAAVVLNGERPPKPTCSPTAAIAWPSSSVRSRFTSRRHPPHRHRQGSAPHRRPGTRTDGFVRIVIAGAGAIGGYLGARLARPARTSCCSRAARTSSAMQDARPAGPSAEGNFEVRPQVTGDLATPGKADVVFLGVKAHGLTTLAPMLGRCLDPTPCS